tara:strand:+ start:71 stop:1255 length:1185 start_codon:yes stop_codon:yes gene_type:complete
MELSNLKSDPVVFVGGGFAGLISSLELSRKQNRPKIILIEPRDRFVFSPLLYEFLSDEINLWELAPTYKALLEDKGIIFIQESVKLIDTNQKKVITESGMKVKYSKVIIGTGSKPNDFGIPGVKDYSLRFNTISDVKLLRLKIKELKNLPGVFNELVIIGGGATGVELACKLSDILQDKVQIHIVEIGTSVLPNGKAFNQEQAKKALMKRKIKIHCQTSVTAINANNIEIQSLIDPNLDSFYLPYRAVIWTAGSIASFPKIIPEPTLIQEKIAIDSYLNVLGFDNALAIGDVSFCLGTPYPSTAQVAMQQGEIAAINLDASLNGKHPKVFEFHDYGEMVSLGIGEASITALGFTISGHFAFYMRRISYLIRIPNSSLRIRSAVSWLLNATKKIK